MGKRVSTQSTSSAKVMVVVLLLVVGAVVFGTRSPPSYTGYQGYGAAETTASQIPLDCGPMAVPPFSGDNLLNSNDVAADGAVLIGIANAAKNRIGVVDPNTGKVTATQVFTEPGVAADPNNEGGFAPTPATAHLPTPTFNVYDCDKTRQALDRLMNYMNQLIDKKWCIVYTMSDLQAQLDELGQIALKYLKTLSQQLDPTGSGVQVTDPDPMASLLVTGTGALTPQGFLFWVNQFNADPYHPLYSGVRDGVTQGDLKDAYLQARGLVTNLQIMAHAISIIDYYYNLYYNYYMRLKEAYEKKPCGGTTPPNPPSPVYQGTVQTLKGLTDRHQPVYRPDQCKWVLNTQTHRRECQTISCGPAPRACDQLVCRCLPPASTVYPHQNDPDPHNYGAPIPPYPSPTTTGAGCDLNPATKACEPANCGANKYCRLSDCTCQPLCGNGILDPGEECEPPGSQCKTAQQVPGTCNNNCQCSTITLPDQGGD